MQWLITLRNALVILALSWLGVTVGPDSASQRDCADANLCISATN